MAGASVEIIGRNGLPVLTRNQRCGRSRSLPGSEELPARTARRCCISHDAAATARSCRSISAAARSTCRASKSAAWKAMPIARALSAYLFSDRGIYRPGEEIRAGAFDSQPGLEPRPRPACRCGWKSPTRRASSIRRETFKPGAAGFGEILQPTKETSPTGTYTLSLSIVRDQYRADLIGSTTVQVRDFQPDRLRMKAAFSATSLDGWVPPDDPRSVRPTRKPVRHAGGEPPHRVAADAQPEHSLVPRVSGLSSSTIRSSRAKASANRSQKRRPTRRATPRSRSTCNASRARRIACTSWRKASKPTAAAASLPRQRNSCRACRT